MHWTNLAGDKIMIYFLFFPENRIRPSMQISIGENLLKCQILFSKKNKKKYFKMLSAEKFSQSAKQALRQQHPSYTQC